MQNTAGASGQLSPGQGDASACDGLSVEIAKLLRLREFVVDCLGSLEARLRSRPEATELTERESLLRRRQAEFAELQRQFQEEMERERQSIQQTLDQIEDDRRLLAEAWERVERERVERLASPPAASSRPGSTVETPRSAAARQPPAAAYAPGLSEAENPVAQSILRQFQTLCGDVRRNSDGRRDS
jgi:hypothetical protein